MDNLLFRKEVYEIVGAAIEVHKELGHGFLAPVYQKALELELSMQKIAFESQKRLKIFYKGIDLEKDYVPDFICDDKIIVEIKALDRLTSKETSQLLNYLKATGLKVGVLINFGSKGKLEWERFVL
jgi:GxxExxY protein